MAQVRGKDTKPELALRRALRAAGVPFTTFRKTLPGNPDVVLSAFKTVVFVHGCFWHSHTCRRGSRPKTNQVFWNLKLDKNKLRDQACQRQLRRAGWSVSVIWECSLNIGISRLIGRLSRAADLQEVRGKKRANFGGTAFPIIRAAGARCPFG